jgi:hypothetical protein
MSEVNEQAEQQESAVAKANAAVLATLDDLKPATIKAEIEVGDGGYVLMELNALTYFRFNKIGLEVADPAPPIGGIDPKTKRPMPDYNDPGYKARLAEAGMRRTLRRIAAAIAKPLIPGESLDEKEEWVRENVSASVVNQLSTLVSAAALRGEARIVDRASRFHGNGTGTQPDLPPNGMED